MFKNIYSLFTIIFIATSCSTNTDPNSLGESTKKIMPLKLNNSWYIKFSHYDTLGNIRLSSNDTLTICCDTTINNTTYYSHLGDPINWYFNDEQGLWRSTSFIPFNIPEPKIYRKYPSNTGDVSGPAKVISTDTTIVTDFGSVSCILYRETSFRGEYYLDHFMCPGIGTIKYTTYEMNSNGKFIPNMGYQLYGYDLK